MDGMEVAMGLIAQAGDARSSCMEAIGLAKEGKFDEARPRWPGRMTVWWPPTKFRRI